MTTRRKPTVARGGVIERQLVQRKIARLLAQIRTQPQTKCRDCYVSALTELREWLTLQPTRTTRPGGIGR